MEVLVQDLYPSRLEHASRIIKRQDPAVYGHGTEGPLTQAQLEAYEREGFLILPDWFSPAEVRAHRAELDRLRGSEAIKARPEAIVERGGNDLRSLFSVHTLSEHYAAVAADDRMAGAARQILGGDVYIHQSRVNLKPGFAGTGFYWHSDFETWHAEDGLPQMRTVSFSILLTPNYAYNGPLMLIPGSHSYFVPCIGRTPEHHYQRSLQEQEIGVPDRRSMSWLAERGGGIRTAQGDAGSLIIFDCNTMHGSNSNITPAPRSNLFFVYNSMENQPVDPFCGLPPRPEHIATRENIRTI